MPGRFPDAPVPLPKVLPVRVDACAEAVGGPRPALRVIAAGVSAQRSPRAFTGVRVARGRRCGPRVDPHPQGKPCRGRRRRARRAGHSGGHAAPRGALCTHARALGANGRVQGPCQGYARPEIDARRRGWRGRLVVPRCDRRRRIWVRRGSFVRALSVRVACG